MNIILLCERSIAGLSPLMGDVPVAELPMVGKSIVEYHLELICSTLKPERIEIITGHYTQSLHALLGDGARWGIQLNYQVALQTDIQLPCLVLPCDRLSSLDIGAFMRQVDQNPEQSAVAMQGDVPGLYWIATQKDLREMRGGGLDPIGKPIVQTDGHVHIVDSIKRYYQANLNLIKGQFNYIKLDQNEAFILGKRARVNASVQQTGSAYLGTVSQIGKSSRLSGCCVIGPHVLIDEEATLEDCVILPHTYVGRWVSIRNAVVSGCYIWRIDTGACLRIDDSFLLCALPATRQKWYSRWLGYKR